mmetsp:Transcript_184591/g.585421  ORF Transcript_184591/g.585421 Transcript_184591/m.585421 type:complete len:554 (-) Transcript_184591:4-1665(-)
MTAAPRAEPVSKPQEGVLSSWEAPDWEAPAPGGWWRVVHKPLVYAISRPMEITLPNGKGHDNEALARLMRAAGKTSGHLCFQTHRGGEVLAMREEKQWDPVQDTHWHRLRDEGAFGEQWIREDAAVLGLGAFIEPLASGSGPPAAETQAEHRHAIDAARSMREEVEGMMERARWQAIAKGGKEGDEQQQSGISKSQAVLLGIETAQFASAAARRLLRLPSQQPLGAEGSASASGAVAEGTGSLCDKLLEDGYVVIADALKGKKLQAFVEEMSRLDDGWNLHVPPQQTPGQRGDRVVWLDEEGARDRFGAPTVAEAIGLLRGIADALNPAVSRHHSDMAASGHPAHVSAPAAPATRERVLTVPPRAMAASYPGAGARYIPHKDNVYRPESGNRVNTRELTAILYANPPDWDLRRDGGALRLYKDSGDAEDEPEEALKKGGWNAEGDRECLLRKGKGPVTIAPLGGRLVIFFSALWHEVMPARRPRRALTLWILRPDLASIGASAAVAAARQRLGSAEDGDDDEGAEGPPDGSTAAASAARAPPPRPGNGVDDGG